MQLSMFLHILVLFSLACTASAHGRLTVPTPRRWKDGITCDFSKYIPEDEAKTFPCMEDPDQPINMDNENFPKNKYNDARYPVNDQSNHPGRQSLVCRVPNGMQDDTVPLLKLEAGNAVKVRWEFAADHPGDGGIYISYDHDYATEQTEEMRFFKIANLPQQRLNNKVDLNVNLPAWLPAGKAVLRWDWYATHNPPWVEFYSNCVDVEIASASNVLPSAIPTYKMQEGTGTPESYPKYYCDIDTGCQDWCFDCDAETWDTLKMNGPNCAPGIAGNCCDLSTYTPAAFNVCENEQGQAACKSRLQDKHGFASCVNVGNSGGTAPGGGEGTRTTTTAAAGVNTGACVDNPDWRDDADNSCAGGEDFVLTAEWCSNHGAESFPAGAANDNCCACGGGTQQTPTTLAGDSDPEAPITAARTTENANDKSTDEPEDDGGDHEDYFDGDHENDYYSFDQASATGNNTRKTSVVDGGSVVWSGCAAAFVCATASVYGLI